MDSSTSRAESRGKTEIVLVLFGVALLLMFAFPAIVGFAGPIGHCYGDAACEAEDVVLRDLTATQGRIGFFGYPIVTLALAAAGFRWWRAWLPVAVLSGVVVLAGLIPVVAGFWEVRPQLHGIPLPLVSPGFTFWIPPAIVFAAAALVGAKHGYARSPG